MKDDKGFHSKSLINVYIQKIASKEGQENMILREQQDALLKW